MKTVIRLAAIACLLAALSIAGCGRVASSVSNPRGSGGVAIPNATIASARSIQEADIYKLAGIPSTS
jgi:hypothetical protein